MRLAPAPPPAPEVGRCITRWCQVTTGVFGDCDRRSSRVVETSRAVTVGATAVYEGACANRYFEELRYDRRRHLPAHLNVSAGLSHVTNSIVANRNWKRR